VTTRALNFEAMIMNTLKIKRLNENDLLIILKRSILFKK